ncbi:MAG: hypothetical protein RLZZ196_1052 [Bacteroidota bacterium]|jgi:hypothetical protein
MVKFFGCSFTQGGGLDNIAYYNYVNKNTDLYELQHEWILDEFRIKNRFTTHITEKYNIPTENLAKSQSSNDYIFDKLFDEIDTNENEIYFVQLSILSRRYWYYDYPKKEVNLNSYDFSAIPFGGEEEYKKLHQHFLDYNEFIFNEGVELKNILKRIKGLDCFAREKNSKIIWTAFDLGDNHKDLSDLEKYVKYVMKFEGTDMKHFCIKHKLQIFDDTNFLVNDNHLSIKGNQMVGDKIYEYLKQNNII